MNYALTAVKARNQAKLLATYLAGIQRKVTHGNALEAVAAMYGKNSWNVLSSELEGTLEVLEPETTASGKEQKPTYLLNGERVVLHISASVRTDDARRDVEFDASPWFLQASDEEIIGLADIDWSGDYAADAVAQYIRDQRLDADVSEFFGYHEAANEALSMFEDPIGFEVRVDREDALKYLRAFKYSFFVKLILADGDAISNRPTVDEDSDQPGLWIFSARGYGSDTSYESESEAYAALGQYLEANDEEFKEILLGLEESGAQVIPGSGNLNASPVRTTPSSLDETSEKVSGRSDSKTGELLILKAGDAPLTLAQMRKITNDCEFYIKVAVPVSLDDLICGDIEGFNDLVSDLITDSGYLSDISFEWLATSAYASMASEVEGVFVVITAGWESDDLDDDESDEQKLEDDKDTDD